MAQLRNAARINGTHLVLEIGSMIELLILQYYYLFVQSVNIQCRSEISDAKMNACDTRIRVFFLYGSKIAYCIRVCAFVIHNHNFAFPVLFAEQQNKLCDCRQVENLLGMWL